MRAMLDVPAVTDAIVGFHAQQAVEKSLKAVLAARGISFPKTHALGFLVDLVDSNGIVAPPALAKADELAPWAVEFRYETESEPSLDRPAALTLVEGIRRWAVDEVER